MRRLLIFLSALLATMANVQAQVVSELEARQYASQFFQEMDAVSKQPSRHHGTQKLSILKRSATVADNEASPAYYIFNRGDDGGFVIVSGDKRTSHSILGYSATGTFRTEEAPANIQAWLDGYAEQITALRQSALTAVRQPMTAPGYPVVEPLITTTWNQDEPYNAQTPKMSGAHTPVGCTAVAMAQIMNYNRWPLRGTGSIEYAWNNSYLDRDFSQCTYDWDNLDVAQLMSDVGIACKMNYGVNSSSASELDAARAYVRNFGYDKGLEFHERRQSDEHSWRDSDWEQMLRDELDARRPVFYSGAYRNGRNYIGHAFVCDGYDDAGYFHFNFGWGGVDDGWYRVTPIDERYIDVFDFQAYQTIITHIQKDAGNPAWMNAIFMSNYSTLIWSFTSDTVECAYQLKSMDTGDIYYSKSVETPLKPYTHTELDPIYGHTAPENEDLKELNLPDGTYQRRTVYRPKGSKEWHERNFHYYSTIPSFSEEYVWVDVVNGNITTSPSLTFKYGEMQYTKVNEEEVALSGWSGWSEDAKDIVIPDSVTYRGKTYPVTDINVSSYEEGKSLTLPKTLHKISQLKYKGTAITVPETVDTIVTLELPNISDLILPSSLKVIGLPDSKEGRLMCANTELTIPEGVEYVRTLFCQSLETLHFPASLHALGNSCLASHETLKTVTFAPGCQLTVLPELCFVNDKRLKGIDLPESLERIEKECFESCGSLKEIAIPASVRFIGAGAFSGCTNLQHITFAEDGNLEEIGGGGYSYNGTFCGCENLEYIVFPSSLKIFNDQIRDCGIVYADFSRTQITEMDGEDAYFFYDCHALETVLLPPTIKKIGNFFGNCEKVTSFVIPKGTESISYLGASNIQSLVIPASVKTFDGLLCNPSTVVICEGMTPPEGSGLADYIYASQLRNFTLYVPAGASQAYKDYEFKFGRYNHIYRIMVPIYEMASETAVNVVADTDGATVVGSTAEGALVLPSTVNGANGEVPVTAIAANAFMGNTTITSVDIPVTVQGSDADVKTRDHSQHSPRSVMGASAGIGQYAFAYCMSLNEVYVHWTHPQAIDETVFRGLDLSKLTLVVPDNTSANYATEDTWKDFGTIIEESAQGIDTPTFLSPSAKNSPIYDLMGRRVDVLRPGTIYVRDGKKIMLK